MGLDYLGLSFETNSGLAVQLFSEGRSVAGYQSDYYSGQRFFAVTGTFSTDAPAPCYARGTLILTERGDVPIERLTAGDNVVTASGKMRPIVWVGHRRVNVARHPDPARVQPVRVVAGAFGAGLPRRDLLLSPDHAVLVDDALIPIKYLRNGASIVQIDVDAVEYWHIELERHDIVLAEGLPAESYLESGGRAGFENGGAAVSLHPDFASRVWDGQACARLVMSGPDLNSARRRLRESATQLGCPHTGDRGGPRAPARWCRHPEPSAASPKRGLGQARP